MTYFPFLFARNQELELSSVRNFARRHDFNKRPAAHEERELAHLAGALWYSNQEGDLISCHALPC